MIVVRLTAAQADALLDCAERAYQRGDARRKVSLRAGALAIQHAQAQLKLKTRRANAHAVAGNEIAAARRRLRDAERLVESARRRLEE